MNILLALIPILAFVWAVRKGQYDDLDTPALDILVDDDRPMPAVRDRHGDDDH
jgi:cbb3-type cytochrome oxidase maturation protein